VSGVGILGLGLHLPPDIRWNDWWPKDLVERWGAARRENPRTLPVPTTEGAERVLAAMRQQAADPFQGAVKRHVLAEDRDVLDMEEAAARAALVDARINAGDIDLLLGYTLVPEYLLSNPSAALHERLGLPRACLTMQADAAAFSFLGQLSLAEAMIRSGRARHALLVQSSIATRLVEREDPQSVLVGDGASAIVLGPVADDYGIEATVAFTDGRYPKTVVASVPGRSWYADGRALMHVADWRQMNEVFLSTAEVCKQSVQAVLQRAGREPRQVDFLCIYQGTPWLRQVVQDYSGLAHARIYDSFAELGYLSAVMLPANLKLARDNNLLAKGDLVLMTGGGTGMTYGATLLRWGGP
jgi:3-oxoacyl-[acyl-carrier-protein] synthase-3